MPLPDRPTSHGPAESIWAQAIHDYAFAPSGCVCTGGSVAMLSSAAIRQLPIDTASDDPGGYVDIVNNRLVIPSGGEGLYVVMLRGRSENGAASDETRLRLYANGVDVSRVTEGNEGATSIQLVLPEMLELSAGDILTAHANQIGSGARADVSVQSWKIARIGFEFGA